MRARYDEAIARFDAVNAEDPHREVAGGEEHPKELLYARRMSARLEALAPDAPETVRLAVRAQHIARWTVPRDRYPMDRRGYRKWRTDLAAFHADTAGAILEDVGYDGDCIARVRSLLRKERLGTDADVQLLEDVACLVFLEHYFGDFAGKHDEAKVVEIVRKTWRKMSPRGRAATRALRFPPALETLVARALEG